MEQVHKETLEQVENALPGRESIDLEIFGTEGIPESEVAAHNQRIMAEFAQKEADRRAASGQSNGPKKPKIDISKELDPAEIKRKLEEHKKAMANGGITPVTPGGAMSPGRAQSPGGFEAHGSPQVPPHQVPYVGVPTIHSLLPRVIADLHVGPKPPSSVPTGPVCDAATAKCFPSAKCLPARELPASTGSSKPVPCCTFPATSIPAGTTACTLWPRCSSASVQWLPATTCWLSSRAIQRASSAAATTPAALPAACSSASAVVSTSTPPNPRTSTEAQCSRSTATSCVHKPPRWLWTW